jgi:uncharacterized repeat protein (TIGR03847 family)
MDAVEFSFQSLEPAPVFATAAAGGEADAVMEAMARAEAEAADLRQRTADDIAAAQARAMAARGSAAVESGRPPCPLCGGPLDPSGHVCPRLNGHSRRDDT